MIQKAIQDITKADIDALIENGVREDRTLEYKTRLPKRSDGDRKKFLADICSFANAAGGDLLFGVAEKRDARGVRTGIPQEAPGIAAPRVDEERQRLETLIRDGIAPRVPNVRIRSIDGFAAGPVLLVRIPRSWAAPHMVAFKGASRFYARNNAGKYPLDIEEIRMAFALSEALPERMRRFREERLARIIADEGPVPLEPHPKIVLHVLSAAALALGFQLDPGAILAQQGILQPIQGTTGRARFNVDGFVTCSGSHGRRCRDYCQVFRNGVVEAVDADLLQPRTGRKFIPINCFEECLTRSAGRYVAALRAVEAPLPLAIHVALLGAAGYEVPVYGPGANPDPTPIDRDLLLLPEVVVDDYEADIGTQLRRIFDAVWNAGGYERSCNYDERGEARPH